MPVTREHPMSALASRCLGQGLLNLAPAEQDALRDLFVKECRKGAFKPSGSDATAILKEFCVHVRAEFADTGTVMTVFDFQPLLRATAEKVASEAEQSTKAPIAALILYATCVEHWVNMMIAVAKLRQGYTVEAILEFLSDKRRRFEEKLGHIGPQSGLSELPTDTRNKVTDLMGTRNDYVHYVWKGEPDRTVRNHVAHVTALVKSAPKLLVALDRFEEESLDTTYAEVCRAIFGSVA
jgi:hypothetical protein